MVKTIDSQRNKSEMISYFVTYVISIPVGGSFDIINIGRFVIIIRLGSINSSNVNEELSVLALMNDTTKDTDILG